MSSKGRRRFHSMCEIEVGILLEDCQDFIVKHGNFHTRSYLLNFPPVNGVERYFRFSLDYGGS